MVEPEPNAAPQGEGTSDLNGTEPLKGKILVVDDEAPLLRAYRRILNRAGYAVETAPEGETACSMLGDKEFDVIISDIAMPGMDGLELLRRIREWNLDVPVVFITGNPAVETAAQAVEFGALRYLVKPVTPKQLEDVVDRAVRLYRIAKVKRQALTALGDEVMQIGDVAGLEASFRRAMESLWIAFQPIVCWSARRVHAYEALLRSNEPTLRSPGALLDAAERLGRLHDVGRAVRERVANAIETSLCETLFCNLHSADLLDDSLFAPDSPLSRVANHVVLEITERASLSAVKDVGDRAGQLRHLGYRIAVDDLGAGYAGLTSFAQLEPEVVKLDMSLIRDVHKQPTKAKLIRSMSVLCRDMGLLVVAEGVEVPEERDALIEIGCDLFQGYLFARPMERPPQVNW